MVALKLNKLIIPMCSITLLIISCASLIEFSNTANWYLLVLVIYVCLWAGDCHLGFRMGYRETPAEFLGMKVSKYLGDDNLSIL